jgi:arylsulfatase A-like enzyme
VPLIARWPERIAPGAVGGQLVSLVDMMATAADIAGVELPEDAGEDSESMLPVLEGRTMRGARREAIVYHAGDGTLAIRRGDWVFIDGPTGAGAKEPEWFRQERGYVPHDLPGELYHLGQDPSEARNLYASEPGTVEELKALLQRYKEAGRSVQRC